MYVNEPHETNKTKRSPPVSLKSSIGYGDEDQENYDRTDNMRTKITRLDQNQKSARER